MTQFSDQLSAVRQAQFEAQLDIFRTLTTRALDSAGQLAALNMRASRASLEQATGTFRHLLDAREPRDLFALAPPPRASGMPCSPMAASCSALPPACAPCRRR